MPKYDAFHAYNSTGLTSVGVLNSVNKKSGSLPYAKYENVNDYKFGDKVYSAVWLWWTRNW